MSIDFTLFCTACGIPTGRSFATHCKQCGGLIDVEYPLDRVRLHKSDNPYMRYRELIPVQNSALLPEATATPLVHARELGKRLGLSRLYLKNETVNPTGTTKYRMAAVALPFLFESGIRHFCASSTGNSSTAYARAIGNLPDMRMELFTAEDFRSRVNYDRTPQVRHHVLRGASFAEAADYSSVFARNNGLTVEGGFFNPGRREGLKLAWLEAVEQLAKPIEWYVQAVSSGMGVYGVYKAAKEAVALGLSRRAPRLLCAQQMSCRPMVLAWEQGCESISAEHIVARPSGIAEAILRGNPSGAYPHIRRVVLESGGTMVALENEAILGIQASLLEDEGIEVCPSAATALAGLARLSRGGRDLSDSLIVVNLTGGLRKEATPASVDRWLERSAAEDLSRNTTWQEALDASSPRAYQVRAMTRSRE